MKISFFAFVALFSLYSFSSYAQAPLRVGRNQLNFGVGISGWGVPLYIGFDHGFKKDITLGGEFSFRSFNDNFNNNKYRHSIISLSANGNYHFNSILSIPRNWDFLCRTEPGLLLLEFSLYVSGRWRIGNWIGCPDRWPVLLQPKSGSQS